MVGIFLKNIRGGGDKNNIKIKNRNNQKRRSGSKLIVLVNLSGKTGNILAPESIKIYFKVYPFY